MTPEALEMRRKYAARVMELEKEIAALTKERNRAYQGSEAQTQDQLSAAQATIAKLREVMRLVQNLDYFREHNYLAHQVDEALALPSDDTTLQERLAAERERCAKELEEVGTEEFLYAASVIRSMK